MQVIIITVKIIFSLIKEDPTEKVTFEQMFK